MRFAAAFSVFTAGLAVLTLAAPGCGGETSEEEGETVEQTGKTPPLAEGAATSNEEERTFAMNALFLGESDRNGATNANAWKKFGYNLDGWVTKATDSKSPDLTKVCKRVQGAEANVHQDGDDGIDNAFGAKILKLISSFATTPSKTITDAITRGDFTILLKIKGLTDEPEQTNTGLGGTLLVGTGFGSTPTFSKTDEWPYLSEPKVSVGDGHITKGVFVNGNGATIKLSLSIQGQSLNLTIANAFITFKHANDGLEDGTIAGMVRASEVVDSVGKIAGNLNKDLCSGATIEGIKNSIRQASDMIYDGAQDPATPCDAISIGLGFTAKRIAKPGEERKAGPPPPDPCAQ